MRLYMVRHADPDYLSDTITEVGHQEALAVADRMAKVGLTHLFVSPMGRARATARYTADMIGLEPVVLPWTAELKMTRLSDMTGAEIAPWNVPGELIRGGVELPTTQNWHQYADLAGYDFAGRQAELAAASDAFLGELGYRRAGGVYAVDAPNDHAVAIFCHAGFGVSWMAHLLALPLTLAWCGFFWAPTSVTTILMERRSPDIAVPRALAVGDTSHIHVAGLAESSRGLTANDR